MTKTDVELLAAKTADAYSYNRYGLGAWRATIRLLARRGYDERQIEAVLRSKWMRWAADSRDDQRRPTSGDVARYLSRMSGGRQVEMKYVAQFTAETFGEQA